MNLADPSRPATVANHPAASGWGVRRAPRHVLAGVALMVTFALLFGLWALRVDPATAVLAVARPVPAGATITDADLQVVRVVPGAGMEVVTEAERATVVGRTATVPLVAGALLAPAHVGAAVWPPAGESVVGVPVAVGRMPAGLSTGSRVSVLVPAGGAPGPPGQPGQPGRAGPAVLSGVVVAVEPASAAGVSTVSLLMASGDARRVAAAGDVVLVLESPGSGR
jgi:hypothetical protein